MVSVFTCFVVFLFGYLALLEVFEGSFASFPGLIGVVSPSWVDWPSGCFTRCLEDRLYGHEMTCLVDIAQVLSMLSCAIWSIWIALSI